MALSPQAESLLAEMARDHGLGALAPDADGLIPITLDGEFAIALAFDAENNSCFMMHVLVPDIETPFRMAWEAFDTAPELAERRTRIALDPTGALVILRDIFLEGLAYWQFSEALEAFVADAEQARQQFAADRGSSGDGGTGGYEPEDFSSEAFVIIRP